MASKTVWIVGGVVVAIGAIAYLSYNKAPAGKDAAGTIVEAKRAQTDGTNSFNPAPTASTTEQNASDASKAMAGPDAAKDAAGAAGGSSDNVLKRKAGEAADAAAADANSNLAKAKMAVSEHTRQAADAAMAAGDANSNLTTKMHTGMHTGEAAQLKAANAPDEATRK
jgi:hypothetical protein